MKIIRRHKNIDPSLDLSEAYARERQKTTLARYLALPATQKSGVTLEFPDGKRESFDPDKHVIHPNQKHPQSEEPQYLSFDSALKPPKDPDAIEPEFISYSENLVSPEVVILKPHPKLK